MKTLTSLLMLIATITATSCSKAPQETALDSNENDIDALSQNADTIITNEIMVEVNGHKLMRDDVIAQVNEHLGNPPENITAKRVSIVKNRAQSKIIDEFVIKALLLDEAERLDISVSEAEKQQAIQKLEEQVPDTTTLDKIIGDDANRIKMEKALVDGIKVQKLLGQLKNRLKTYDVTEKDIAAYISKNPAPKVSNDVIKIRIQQEREQKQLMEYIHELHSKADIKHSPSVTPPDLSK